MHGFWSGAILPTTRCWRWRSRAATASAGARLRPTMARNARQGSRLTAEPIAFTFDGRKIPARRGDTAASALLAHGVRLMGRSVKYRRVRGVLTADFEEPN